jgi:peptide/nickel transport system substrate-binding protein
VLPKHFYSQFTEEKLNQATGLLMGSGAYKLENLDKDNQWAPPAPVNLVKNQQYWGEKRPLDRLRFSVVTDEMARITGYRNGEADFVTPSAPQYKALTAEPEWAKENQSLNWVNMKSGNSFIAWNCGERNGKLTPFADKRVRKAMTYLLDREKMVRDVWGGIGEVSKGVANPASPASPPDLKPLPFDPKAGKALLAEAGWMDRDGNGVLEDPKGNEFVFEFTYSAGGEISKLIATFVKDSYARAGIVVSLHPIDWSVGDPIRKSRNFDALTMSWGASAPESDPRQIWHSIAIKNQGDNFIQWNCPAADELIDKGRRELNREKRMKIWHEFERVVADEQPYTWIRIQPYLRFVKADVGNVVMHRKGPESTEFFRLSGGPALPGQGN